MQDARRLNLCIAEEQEGKRVDTLLRRELNLSGSALRRAKRIQQGITLDGETVYSNALVKKGQVLSVQVGDVPSEDGLSPMPGKLCICYEDEDVLVVDKAAPLAVHPSPTYADDTLANHMLYYYQTIGLVADFHPVNRLDRGTSGLMVVAKHAHAHERLSTMLHTPHFQRTYLAVCEGVLEPSEGLIDAPIGRIPGEVLRREVRTDGAPARTHYRTLFTDGKRSLVSLSLETGRTHQIRVHLSSMSCPIVGDFLYGTETRELPDRFALHSAKLRFCHPISGEALHIQSDIPKEFVNLYTKQTKKQEESREPT